MQQKMYCYSTAPIDDWAGMHTIPSLEREFGDGTDEAIATRDQLQRILGACLAGFRELGWEGDTANGPAFFQVPDPDCACFRWGVVVKQANNGECFVGSPFPMEHLLDADETNSVDVNVEL